jgi:hypothetical protein
MTKIVRRDQMRSKRVLIKVKKQLRKLMIFFMIINILKQTKSKKKMEKNQL